jgi:hypothetical protein
LLRRQNWDQISSRDDTGDGLIDALSLEECTELEIGPRFLRVVLQQARNCAMASSVCPSRASASGVGARIRILGRRDHLDEFPTAAGRSPAECVKPRL